MSSKLENMSARSARGLGNLNDWSSSFTLDWSSFSASNKIDGRDAISALGERNADDDDKAAATANTAAKMKQEEEDKEEGMSMSKLGIGIELVKSEATLHYYWRRRRAADSIGARVDTGCM